MQQKDRGSLSYLDLKREKMGKRRERLKDIEIKRTFYCSQIVE
jgi:hypothetical protein